MKQTLEQKRAADAFKKVEKLKKDRAIDKEKYISYTKSLPATIITNGLGQAAASLLAAAKENNKKDAHYLLYKHLEEWLCRDSRDAPYPQNSKQKTDAILMRSITDHGRNKYMQAQAEAIAWLKWLKKFAVAYLA